MSPSNLPIEYTYYGCFNSLPRSGSSNDQALPYKLTNGSKNDGLLYTRSDCSSAAIGAGVIAFGMQNKVEIDGIEYGNCFLSDDPNSTHDKLHSEEQINSAVLYGSPDASLNMCYQGIGKINENINAVYVNNSAIDFFNDASVSQRTRESVNNYISSLHALNLRFANVINQIHIAESQSTAVYEASVSSHTNEIKIIIKEMMLLKLGLEKTCENINNKIDYLNSELNYTDNKKTLAELKLHRLYGSDNASAGWLSDSKKLTTIMNIENISLIAVAIIFISIYHIFKKTPS